MPLNTSQGRINSTLLTLLAISAAVLPAPKLTAILIKVGGNGLFKAGLRMAFKTDRQADQDAKNQIG